MSPSNLGGLGPTVIGVVWTEAVIGTTMVALRAYAASKKHGKWRWDFIWVAIALFAALLGSIIVTVAATKGLGNYYRSMTFPQLFEAVKWIWMSIWFGLPPSALAKWAIIALLIDVQGPAAKKRRMVLWALAFLVGASSVTQIFLSLFQCKPVNKLWLLTNPGECPHKMVSRHFSYGQAAIQATADLTLALWPISIVWDLQTSLRVKIGFCILMAVGVFASAAIILRTLSLPSLVKVVDPTYEFGTFMLWAVTEVWLVIILGSIPPLRPLFLRVFYGINPRSSAKDTSASRTYAMGGTGNGRSITKSQTGKHPGGVVLSRDDISEDGSDRELAPQEMENGILVVNKVTVDDSTPTPTSQVRRLIEKGRNPGW